jgi:hypothetical protein
VAGAAVARINSEMLSYEIGRLRALCKRHGIDPDIPKGGEMIPVNKKESILPAEDVEALLARKG